MASSSHLALLPTSARVPYPAYPSLALSSITTAISSISLPRPHTALLSLDLPAEECC